jgi:hypothetical protein
VQREDAKLSTLRPRLQTTRPDKHQGFYCAVVVAPANGDVVATFGLMTSVGDCAESTARTMTVLVEVAVRPVWSLATY